MIGTLKPTVKSNLSFEYGNPISKVELNTFYPWLHHLRGIPQTLLGRADISDNNYMTYLYLPIILINKIHHGLPFGDLSK